MAPMGCGIRTDSLEKVGLASSFLNALKLSLRELLDVAVHRIL